MEMFGGESPGGKWGDLARLEADLTQSADQRFLEKSGTAGDLLDEAPQVPGMLNRTVMILNSSMRGIFGINHARNLALLNSLMGVVGFFLPTLITPFRLCTARLNRLPSSATARFR